jgi:hypothetical protein
MSEEMDEGQKSEGTGEERGRKASGREGGMGGAEAATSRGVSPGQQSAAHDATKKAKLSQKLPMKRKIGSGLENPMAADAAALSRQKSKRQTSGSAQLAGLMHDMSKIKEGQPRKFCKEFIYMDSSLQVQSLQTMNEETVLAGVKGLDFWSPRQHSEMTPVRMRVNASMWNQALCYLLPFSGSFTWPFSGACHPKNHKNGMRSDW